MKKRPRDPAQLAKFIVDVATGQVEENEPPATPKKIPLTKRQAAELGGKKRAVSLTKKRRKEIASKAARQRWNAS